MVQSKLTGVDQSAASHWDCQRSILREVISTSCRESGVMLLRVASLLAGDEHEWAGVRESANVSINTPRTHKHSRTSLLQAASKLDISCSISTSSKTSGNWMWTEILTGSKLLRLLETEPPPFLWRVWMLAKKINGAKKMLIFSFLRVWWAHYCHIGFSSGDSGADGADQTPSFSGAPSSWCTQTKKEAVSSMKTGVFTDYV